MYKPGSIKKTVWKKCGFNPGADQIGNEYRQSQPYGPLRSSQDEMSMLWNR
jgi:hypothetical protein